MQEPTAYFMEMESVRNISLSEKSWEIQTKCRNGWRNGEKIIRQEIQKKLIVIKTEDAIILRKLMILRVMAFSDR